MGRGCGEDGALLQPAPAALAHGRGMCAPAIGPPQCLLHPCRCHAARTMPAPRASRAHNRDGGPRGLGAGIPHAAQSSSSAPAARHSTAPHRFALEVAAVSPAGSTPTWAGLDACRCSLQLRLVLELVLAWSGGRAGAVLLGSPAFSAALAFLRWAQAVGQE